MKEIWKKTSLFYKIIAVLLTVVMVGTTMYFHFEKKYVAKAEGNPEAFLAYSDDGTNWNKVTDGAVGSKIGRNFAVFINNNENSIEKIRYKTDGNALTESDGTNITTLDYTGYTGLEGNLYKIDINFDDFVSFNWAYTCADSTETPGTSVTVTKQSPVNTMTVKHGGTQITGNENTGYYKSGETLTVEVQTTGTLTGLNILDQSVTDFNPTTNNNLDIDSDIQSGLTTYRYTYTFSGNTNVTYSAKTISATTSISATNPILNVGFSTLIYDQTKPKITAKVGTEDLNSDKWYNTDSIVFTVTSGGTTDETPISSVTATVGGTAASLTNNNNGTYTLSNVSNGANVIVVTATDAAENTNDSTDGTFTFKVDKNEKPSISSVDVEGKNIDGFVKLNDSDDVIISGLTHDTTSGVAKLNVAASKTDGPTYTLPEIEISSFAPGDYNYSFNLSSVLNPAGDNPLNTHSYDGTYTISVYPIDAAGNIIDPMTNTFKLDTTKPAIEKIAFEKWDGTQWINDDGALTSDTIYINKTNNSKVRFKLTLTEANIPDLNPIKVYNGDSEFTDCSTYPDGGYYYVEIDSNKLSSETSLTLNPKCVDKAGNVSDDCLLTPLRLVDSAIKVNLTGLTIGENSVTMENVEDIGSLITNKNVKDKVTIKVVAKSGFNITEVTLTNGTDFTKTATLSPITPDAEGIYTTDEITFVIPEETLNNTQISALKLYVKDGVNPEKVIPVGDLLYDNTDPEITITNSDYSSTKWYQDYKLQYNLVSGKSAIESDLVSASYTINGTVNDVAVSGTKIENASTNDIPESTSVAGTTVSFAAEDKATNSLNGGVFVVKVDKTNPTVADIKVNGKAVDESIVIAGTPQLTSNITDNLTVKDYAVTVKYNDEAYAVYPVSVEKDATEEGISHTLQQVLGSKELKDGKYTVSISARDKSERSSNVAATTFIVDNTAPVVTANILSGTTGKNNGYYNSDVVVRLTCKDNNFNPAAMSVTDNGSAISADWKTGNDMYYADVTLSSEGLHDIRVSGNDKAGTAAQAKQVTFTIDKTVPTVSLLVNGGQIYNESRGTLNLTGPLTFTASVSDTNEDAGDLRVQVIKTVPDTATTTSEFLPTGERTFTFADEADYVINIFAIDKANNQGPTRTISFRVDTTAPQLTITGAGGTAASATSVSFNITEAFWADAKGTVEIYRKAGDGVDETLYKTLTLTPTQRAYSLSELLRESGVYRFEFTADDKVGHTATASQSITVDLNKPEITLTGVNNYDSTDGSVSISAVIKDEFYASKKVSIQGTRTDASGKKTAVSFSPFATTANPTTINDTFTEEGIYDITLTATDIAGNVTSNSVHFTIDTSDPVIGDLSMYDGKTFNAKSFEDIGLDIDLDEIVSDLTVCQVRMYLNGSEYDGISEIEDGSYTLLITAEDELGHTSEKSATFVLDTKEPIFIVTGVEDGEVRNDSYSIEVSLQLDEDTLEEVKLNDTVITVKNNVASLSVSDKGEYKLYMKATDEAGNEAEQTITFTFGEEQKSVTTAVSDAVEKAASHWWIWAIVVAAILAVGGLIFFILKRRKED